MIGGIVIETVIQPKRIWVNTVESSERCNSKCAIYVERNDKSERIRPGDSLWWQGGSAMWTPYENKSKPNLKGGVDYDIRIPRIGFSGASKPE